MAAGLANSANFEAHICSERRKTCSVNVSTHMNVDMVKCLNTFEREENSAAMAHWSWPIKIKIPMQWYLYSYPGISTVQVKIRAYGT